MRFGCWRCPPVRPAGDRIRPVPLRFPQRSAAVPGLHPGRRAAGTEAASRHSGAARRRCRQWLGLRFQISEASGLPAADGGRRRDPARHCRGIRSGSAQRGFAGLRGRSFGRSGRRGSGGTARAGRLGLWRGVRSWQLAPRFCSNREGRGGRLFLRQGMEYGFPKRPATRSRVRHCRR